MLVGKAETMSVGVGLLGGKKGGTNDAAGFDVFVTDVVKVLCHALVGWGVRVIFGFGWVMVSRVDDKG